MSATALTLVLLAALLHASWNALVKGAGDRALTLAAVAAMHGLGGVVLIAISAPPAIESWPSIAASTVIHYFYYLLLFQAYRFGDLSQVYPISRGIAPALREALTGKRLTILDVDASHEVKRYAVPLVLKHGTMPFPYDWNMA